MAHRLDFYAENTDLVAAGARYHIDCNIKFNGDRPQTATSSLGRPSGQAEKTKEDTFLRLTNFLDFDEET